MMTHYERNLCVFGALVGALLWAVSSCLVDRVLADTTYPVEAWPEDDDVEDLNATTDDATGLPYIAQSSDAQSSPPLMTQLDRMFQRRNAILAGINKLRVVKADSTHIGIFPGQFRLSGTSYYYPGEDDKAVTTSNDTYYVYLTTASDEGSDGTATIVTDATGWPSTACSYIPLAEITVAANVISAITDVRARVLFGTELNASLGAISALAKTDGNIIVGNGSTWVAESGATARTSLGVAIGSDVQAYDADLSAIGALAKTDSNVIVGNGSTWVAESGDTVRTSLGVAIGSDVQAYDADLAAVAGLSGTGLIAHTGAGTASLRSIIGGTAITVTYGDGASGNPSVAVTGASLGLTQLAAAVVDLMPKLNVSAGSQSDHTRAITIQLQDADGNSLGERVLVQLWIDDSAYGAADATGNAVSVTTGTTLETITANAHYTVVSDGNGTVVFDLTVGAGGTRYIMAEIDGRIYSSGAVEITS